MFNLHNTENVFRKISKWKPEDATAISKWICIRALSFYHNRNNHQLTWLGEKKLFSED